MGPKFSAELIAALAARVRAHNEAQPVERVKLTDLKKRYANGYRGRTDEERTAAAWDSVNALLDAKLQKAFEPDKHPRGKGGKFAGSGGAAPIIGALPTTRAQHQALQQTNPAYAALTSDVVPEHRNQIEGMWLRRIAGTAAGAALVLPLLRHGGGSIAGRALRRYGGMVGRYSASVPTATLLYPAASAGESAANLAGRVLRRPIKSGIFYSGAEAATQAAGAAGEWTGRRLGAGGAHGLHIVLRGLDRAAGNHPNPTIRAARRLGLHAGLSLGAGAVLTAPITGTALDPEQLGAGVDAFSYRTVQKMVRDDAARLDAVTAEVLQKFAPGGALIKRGLWSAAGHYLLPAAAAVGAGLGGAGAAEAAHAIIGTRVYHRDSHGRFASAANAVTAGAALAGAIGGGLLTYLAIRHGNVRALSQAVAKGIGKIDANIARARSPEGMGPVAEKIIKHTAAEAKLKADRPKDIADEMAKDEKYKADKAALDLYGGSHEQHFKSRIRDDVNGKLASYLSQINEFRLPGGGTVGQLRAQHGGAVGHADKVAFDRVREAVDGMSPDDKAFKAATADLTPAQTDTVRHWLTTRASAIDAVPDQLAAHKAKLEELVGKVKDAEAAHEAAKTAVTDAQAVAARAGNDTDKLTADTTHNAAIEHEKAAGEAVKKALAAVTKHRAKASGITSPTSGLPIPAASESELEPLRTKLRSEAEKRAEAKVDAKAKKTLAASQKEIDDARAAQIAKHEMRGHRLLAAQAFLGRKLNITPDRALVAGTRAAFWLRALRRAHATEMSTLRDLVMHQRTLAALKAAQKGKIPAGMSREDAADLVARADHVANDVAKAPS